MLLGRRYRLLKRLGRGGMGTVWEALDEKLRRRVAVKLMAGRFCDDKRLLARFEREAMAIARLHSPHIVQVYDYGVEAKQPYTVMELLTGEDLSQRLRRDERLDLMLVVRVATQLGKALATAHAAGIAHRDLKPSNIFLVRDHDEDVAKIFDFGISKALQTLPPGRRLTEAGALLGTPQYMSPEQMLGSLDVDHSTDLWSLGAILYRMCCARLPFRATRSTN